MIWINKFICDLKSFKFDEETSNDQAEKVILYGQVYYQMFKKELCMVIIGRRLFFLEKLC